MYKDEGATSCGRPEALFHLVNLRVQSRHRLADSYAFARRFDASRASASALFPADSCRGAPHALPYMTLLDLSREDEVFLTRPNESTATASQHTELNSSCLERSEAAPY
eukprot:6180263-Pleurochrysis_carterae.AAC.3